MKYDKEDLRQQFYNVENHNNYNDDLLAMSDETTKEVQNVQVGTQPTVVELSLQCSKDTVLKSLVRHHTSPGVLAAQWLEHLTVKSSVLPGHCAEGPS